MRKARLAGVVLRFAFVTLFVLWTDTANCRAEDSPQSDSEHSARVSSELRRLERDFLEFPPEAESNRKSERAEDLVEDLHRNDPSDAQLAALEEQMLSLVGKYPTFQFFDEALLLWIEKNPARPKPDLEVIFRVVEKVSRRNEIAWPYRNLKSAYCMIALEFLGSAVEYPRIDELGAMGTKMDWQKLDAFMRWLNESRNQLRYVPESGRYVKLEGL